MRATILLKFSVETLARLEQGMKLREGVSFLVLDWQDRRSP